MPEYEADSRPEFSIVIPVYNEEEILRPEVERIVSTHREIGIPFEVLLIENGSIDRTPEIASNLSGQYREVKVHNMSRPSYGQAMKYGIEKTSAGKVVIYNIDYWNKEFCETAVKRLDEVDVVVASKRMDPGRDKRPWIRKKITWGFNLLLRIFFGFRGTDTHGIKAARREAIIPILRLCRTDKEIFDTEVILRCERAGLRRVELPIDVEEKRATRYSLLSRVPNTLGDLLTLALALRITPIGTSGKEMFYEDFAEKFDEKMNYYDLNRRIEVVFDEFLQEENLQGKKLLDGGCGTGWLSKRACERGAKVTSVDVGQRLLNEVGKKCDSETVVGDVLDLQFPDQSFDFVVSSEVIEHTTNPRKAVRELIRVLKPGGTLVITCPNKIWHFAITLANLLGLRPYEGFENWVGWFELKRWIEDEGLVVKEQKGFHLFPFVFSFLNPVLRFVDRFGKMIGPIMLNIGIKARKPPPTN